MSDFDEVLERLVGDPAFASALAADPGRALAGYRLSDDEVALLHTQVGGESTDHAVETRANQSSTFGLLGSLTGMLHGGLPGIGDQLGGSGMGHAPGGAASGMGAAATSGMGVDAYASETYMPPAAGPAPDTYMPPMPDTYMPEMPGGRSGLSGLSDQIADGIHSADAHGTGVVGDAGFGAAPLDPPQPAGGLAPPEGYHTRVDVDGDGHWDKHIAVGRADGGVDIYVDRNNDGRVDFIGHDDDADGLVESADYDKDRDGFFEKTMYDDDGDGWLDRTVRHTPPGH